MPDLDVENAEEQIVGTQAWLHAHGLQLGHDGQRQLRVVYKGDKGRQKINMV